MSRIALTTAVLLALAATPSAGATRTWTGGNGGGLWSNPLNWSPQGIPQENESLFFPANGGTNSTNDLPAGMTFDTLSLTAISYSLNGNAFRISGQIVGYSNNTRVIHNDVTFLDGSTGDAWLALEGTTTIAGTTRPGYQVDFRGPLNGSGHISVGGVSTIVGGGNFTGTISTTGILDIRDSFAVTVDVGRLMGTATIGAATVGGVHPGPYPLGVGTLTTGSLTIRAGSYATYFGLTGGGSDQVVVNGAVKIGAAELELSHATGAAPGQTWVLIANDGSDPIDGRFANAPDGGIVQGPGGRFVVSYSGGDGNDLAVTAIAGGKTWVGNAGNQLWSSAANWLPAGAPVNGESLYFPWSFATDPPLVNDLAGLELADVTLEYGRTLSGNAITIRGNVATAGSDVFGLPITFAGTPVVKTWTHFGSEVIVTGDLRLEDYTKFTGNLRGSGTIVGPAGLEAKQGDFSGRILTAYLALRGDLPGAKFDGGSLSGYGSIGDVVAKFIGLHDPDTFPPRFVTIQTGNLQFGNSGIAFEIELGSTGTDAVVAKGAVSLSGTLVASLRRPDTLAPGTIYTIIDNDGTDAVMGTFTGQPEGQVKTLGGGPLYRISYAGGDGNDVTATIVILTSASLTASSAKSVAGDTITLTANVVAEGGASPVGSFTFASNSGTLGTVAVVNGKAQLDVQLDPRFFTHSISANFAGSGAFGNSAAFITHHVFDRPVLTVSTNPDGSALSVTVRAANRPATVPNGFVKANGGTAVPLQGGSATIPLPPGTFDGLIVIEYFGGTTVADGRLEFAYVAPRPFVDIGDVSVSEGEAGTHTITLPVTLSKPWPETVTVQWQALDETAHAASDYVAGSGSLVIPPGETGGRIALGVVGDEVPEDDETFAVRIVGVTNAVVRDDLGQVRILTDDEFYATHHDVEYARRGATPLLMTLRVPATGKAPFPVIVSIEAGWWSLSNHHGMRAETHSRRGYAVATVGFTPSTTAKFPAQLDDVKAAIRFLRTNATKYQLEGSTIGVFGVSAGGHLAALLANADADTKVQAIAIWSAPTDVTRLDGCGMLAAEVSTLLGCTNCSAQTSASPIYAIGEGAPPFLIMHGSRDCEVPDDHARALRDALVGRGIPVTLMPVDLEHGGPGWNDAGLQDAVGRFFDQWLRGLVVRRRSMR